MTYIYYVVFENDDSENGSGEFRCYSPIDTIEKIHEMGETFRKQLNWNIILVTNFIFLRTEK
jgi:hypothetical protein